MRVNQPLRQRRRILGMIAVAIRFRAPDMHLVHRPNDSALNQLHHTAIVSAGVDLRAHLGNTVMFGSGLRHEPRLGDGVGQRFLAIDMESSAKRRQCRQSMHVVGGGNDHGIDALLIEEPAEVGGETRPGTPRGAALSWRLLWVPTREVRSPSPCGDPTTLLAVCLGGEVRHPQSRAGGIGPAGLRWPDRGPADRHFRRLHPGLGRRGNGGGDTRRP